LTLVPLQEKSAKFHPWAESLNFPTYSNFLFGGKTWHLFLEMGPKYPQD
jgi:hypothetical protein